MPWDWIFAQIIGDGRSTKVAKIMVVHWHLTFLCRGQVCFPMHLYGHHTFVWEKCWEFQTTSPLMPLGQCCSNVMWSLLGTGEWKIVKIVAVHLPRWPPWPYMVNTFKNLLLQNRVSRAESLQKSLGMGGLPKVAKMMVIHWRLTFLWWGQICFRMHLYGHHTFVWKKWW